MQTQPKQHMICRQVMLVSHKHASEELICHIPKVSWGSPHLAGFCQQIVLQELMLQSFSGQLLPVLCLHPAYVPRHLIT